MSTSSVVLNSKKGPSTIKRAKFGPGMLLQHEDLEQLNLYTRDLSRLLFRSFFGCGVICGLEVEAADDCGKTMVTVHAGVALGCIGDPIYVPKDVKFAATDGCDPDKPSPLWVWLCSCPKCCAPRTPSCGCDDGDHTPACTREVDWYEIHLGTPERPECACGCKPEDSSSNLPQQGQSRLGATGEMLQGTPSVVGAHKVLLGEDIAETPGSQSTTHTDDNPCHCATSHCYDDHYAGKCGCKCEDSNCVILAVLTYGDKTGWTPDYRVRRFIRPVLARDPLAKDPAAQTSSMISEKTAAEKKTP